MDPNSPANDRPNRQYISLSKRHHPDHNPEDRSGSSARFMKIAEAYAILGSPSKREHYDLSRPSASSSYGAARAAYPQGSHSSASASAGPFGARPASGLSRRRTHFRGPPPSFYRSGGWGAQAAKRRQGAEAAAAAAAGAASAAGADGPGADTGTGAGAAQAGWADNDVPHWDREAHFRTQEQQQRRRKRRLAMRDDMTFMGGGSLWLNFLFVSGILALGIAVPGFFGSYRSRGPDQDRRAKDVTDG